MRTNTKAVFSSHDIEYKGGKILSPWGQFITLPLTVGTNGKLGVLCASFSTLNGNETLTIEEAMLKTAEYLRNASLFEITGTCDRHCDGCYCDGGNYVFDSTKAALVLRTILARFYTDFLKRAIIAQLEAFDIRQVRIHASGDFFSTEYITMWKEIVNLFPTVDFWTYTKREEALEAFKNTRLSIVPSVTPYGYNYGTCAELLDLRKKLISDGYNVHVCGCGTPYEKHCDNCTTGCKRIGKGIDFVLFIKHGTKDYKANKHDKAEYTALCEIIASQDN